MRNKIRKMTVYRGDRHGNVMVMLAVMLIAVFACTALCIDIGYTTVTKSELQNAADSAAIAGAGQLQNFYGSYSLAPRSQQDSILLKAKESATAQSTRYAAYNAAGGVSNLSLPASDVTYGFTDAAGKFTTDFKGFPNTLQVMTRRDSSANSPLSLFIAPAIGRKSVDLTATASATVYTGLISSFNPRGGGEAFDGSGGGGWSEGYDDFGEGFECTLLPVAFDVNSWNQFLLNGKSPNGNVYVDSSGVPQIKIYPTPFNSPGNFGLLCIGASTNANPNYVNWILNGPSADDLQALVDGGSYPVSVNEPKPWKGTPGLHSNLVRDFEAIIGEPRLLPLFKPVSSGPYQAARWEGSNTTYDIVGFAGVMVSQATGNGENMEIFVQPCDVIDPTAVFDLSTIYPAGAEPVQQIKMFTHPAPKFTK